MDSEVKTYRRSLPPLVEGKIHGSLKLVINEVLWIKRNPGDITIVVSWWGEHDSAQFRLIDGITNITEINTTEIYTIKTNAALFEDYIKNSETIELVIITEKTHRVIGTAHVGKLSKIFSHRHYSQFAPILNNSGNKIGKIHVSLQLTYLTKFPNTQLKTCKYTKKQIDSNILSSAVDNLRYNGKVLVTSYENMDNIKENSIKSINVDTYDTYRSVLNIKQPEFQESRKEFNEMVTDKLVAKIIARAQRLRRAILKETYNDDSLALNDNLTSNAFYPYASVENKAKLYEYILGSEMTSLDEKKILKMLRAISPTSSLIDLTSKTITVNKANNADIEQNKNSPVKSNNSVEDASYKETTYTKLKGTHPLDYIDCMRIFIESFTLSPAGYRHAKSTCLQRGIALSLMYFIQYDITFASIKQTNMKSNKGTKFIRTCTKKQVGRVIDFNSEGIYNISRCIMNTNFPLRFKIFVRHLNQKFSTELGFGFMNISDIANTTNLSITQYVTIINKDIKMGELKVTAELGYDFIHFGKELVDAVISDAKENIPILEIKSLMNKNGNKYRNATGTHSSKSNSKISPVSAKRIERLTSNSSKDLITTKDVVEYPEQSLDNKKIDTSNLESANKNKVLLHGLIYVAEGKDLPEFNTYLICRAFWREDKATSQICSNTKNPLYHFFQLVPLIHGIELLDRIRNNYIIIEVYNRHNSGIDNLLGIAKLSLHQLYIAYRDPLVLPHLLLSKYPVISVDGWVSINDPISGKRCGELLALVALGTAEQIALLEVSRGLKDSNIISRTVYSYHHRIPDSTNNAMNGQKILQYNVSGVSNLNSEQSTCDNNFAYHNYDTSDRDLIASVDYKIQESQINISSLKDARLEKPIQKIALSEHFTLHPLVERSVNTIHANNISIDQTSQTDINQVNKEQLNRKELHVNTLNSNSLTDNNDTYNPKNDFQLSTEMYRSVGVGAEYEYLDQQQDNVYNNPSNLSIMEEHMEKKESNTNYDVFFFRSIVEIECALHLPKIERLNESVEPSAYVTFQDLTHKLDSNGRLNSYMVTNVFPHSCNPKWNWKCDAKLPTDLLLNNHKRLILKVWHLINPDKFTEVNLGKDIVIGFSAIDLSVLMAGFSTVSGWFHIIDFTGKCNGQIKISVIPLDNLQPLRKFTPVNITNLSGYNNLSQTNWSYLYNASYSSTESSNAHQILSYVGHDNDRYVQNNCNDLAVDVGHNLEDVSMSSLSSSLKQKLTELDEITKRLQSRLRDVTNTAFEDEFDNDFDMIELNNDNENIDDKNIETLASQCTVSMYSANEMLQVPKHCEIQSNRNFMMKDERQISIISNNYNPHFEASNQSKTVNSEATDTGYCSSFNTRFNQHSGFYQNRYDSTHNCLSSNNAGYPARGTKTHINHLLDKLSLDLPPRLPPGTAISMKRDILELFANLRKQRNNSQDNDNNNRGINICSVPTQTDNMTEQHAYFHTTNFTTSDTTVAESIPKSSIESQPHNRISTVIREELIAEENNDSSNCDELTTYLITSNVRHMDLDNIFNPLFYQHLMPDLQVVATIPPEGEAAEQLDNRYARSFAAMRDNKIDHLTENDALPHNNAQLKSRTNVLESEENTEFFHLIPSDVSRNIDNSIDVTVIYKCSDNDLTSGNNTESTAVTLFDKSLVQQIDEVNHCSTVSELFVPTVSRQAPEGGNPAEEVKLSVVTKQQNDNQNISVDN